MSHIGFDSFISSDWENVYVDNNAYLDDYKYRRVRFSMAHELGHLILHKEIYESLKVKSLQDYYSFYENGPGDQYSFLETQANNFASYFLVPRDVLIKHIDKNNTPVVLFFTTLTICLTKKIDYHANFDYLWS